MYSSIYEEAKEMYEELVNLRRDLHQMPELGLSLPQTAAYVEGKLQEWEIPYEKKVNGNCIVGYLGEGEHCLLLRADMDGLPVREESDLPFVSQNGNMHACGHDLHAASLLGAAKLLKKHEKELKGRVKLLFQPGEEIFQGAKAAVADGVLQNPTVDAAFAVHVVSGLSLGSVAYGTVTNASVYGFQITVKGKGTHGAMPQNGIDPIQAGVQIYQGLQELIARECAPDQEVSLTIGMFQAGTVGNIIPETAVLQGTLRTFNDAVRIRMIERIKEVVAGICMAYHAQGTVEALSDIPSLRCDEERTERLAKVFQSMSGELQMISGAHTTASEDFAVIASQVPSSFFNVGAKVEAGPVYEHHNPKVCFREEALPIGVSLYACAALDWE